MKVVDLKQKLLFFIALIFLVFTFNVNADEKDGDGIKIISINADIDTGTLVITGMNLLGKEDDDDDDNFKQIILGDNVIVIQSWTDTMIDGFLPPGTLAGDYRLYIQSSKEDEDQISYDLTLGAVGAQGDAGPQGAVGPQGTKGDTGATGAQGNQGDRGVAGRAGARGFLGPRGFTGRPGRNGVAGRNGLAGQDGSSCSVTQGTRSATIYCENGTRATISSGNRSTQYVTGRLFVGTRRGYVTRRELSFTKLRTASDIRITYTDSFRTIGSSGTCNWDIRIDGNVCRTGRLIYSISNPGVQSESNIATIVGYCRAIPAGRHSIAVYATGLNNAFCYNGQATTYLLEVEEVN